MTITPTSPVSSTSNYLQLQPIMAALESHADKNPKNSLPVDTDGAIVANNLHAVPEVTIYNAHGIVTPSKPNSLIAYA